jgi:hypothetical protein
MASIGCIPASENPLHLLALGWRRTSVGSSHKPTHVRSTSVDDPRAEHVSGRPLCGPVGDDD